MHGGDTDTEDSFSGDEENEDSGGVRVQLDQAYQLIQASVASGSDAAAATKPADGKAEGGEAGEGGRGKQDSGGSEEQGEEATTTSKKEGGSSNGGGSNSSGKEEDVGDPEMTPVYLKRLLPIFTEIYHSSLAPPLRKESLRLMRKMMHYITSTCLQDLCKETTPSDPSHPLFSAQISEVIAAVLESEDDCEGHLSALHIMQELLAKDRTSFDEQFARLGLPTKISGLAASALEEETEVEEEEKEEEGAVGVGQASSDSEASAKNVERTEEETDGAEVKGEKKRPSKKKKSKRGKGGEKAEEQPEQEAKKEVKMAAEDATEISTFLAYQWREWSVVRSRDCLYLWSSCCAIELSCVSNGWFRFLVDNRLATMYSSGSTEGGPDSHGKGFSTLG